MKQIETIQDLQPDPHNANLGTERGHAIIEHSIRKHGAGRSGLAAKDGTMVAGSQTLQKMAELGMPIRAVHTDGSEWVVVIRDDLEPDSPEARALAIEDNRASEEGLQWAPEVLARAKAEGVVDDVVLTVDEVRAIEAAQAKQVEPGGGGDEFDTTPDDGPTRAQLGDLWVIGGVHRLVVGDCTDPAVVERLMDGGRFDLLVTSPPYNSGDGGYKTDYSGKTKKFYVEKVDDRTEDEWVDFCNLVLYIASIVARDEMSTVVWNVMYTARCRAGYGRVMFAGAHPFTVKETICWDKGAGFPTASRGILSRNWELVFVLSQGEKYHTTQGLNEPRWAKWDIPRPHEQLEEHHATYPLELAGRAMGDFSQKGFAVYDPFLGSGTTLIAAHRTGRRCYGCEISPKYADVILRRAEAEGLTVERDVTPYDD